MGGVLDSKDVCLHVCILAFSDVSGFRDGRSEICFSVPYVGPVSRRLGRSQDCEPNKELPAQVVLPSLFTSGRLPPSSCRSRGSRKSLLCGHRPFLVGVTVKWEEFRAVTR